jgi:20S proteasome alpha/beta subunit
VTLIVGILCEDGVVLASDSAATYAAGTTLTIGQQEVTKIHKLGDDFAYASTGSIGVSQLVVSELEKLVANKTFTKNFTPIEAMMMIGAITFGKICLSMIRAEEAPSEAPASLL